MQKKYQTKCQWQRRRLHSDPISSQGENQVDKMLVHKTQDSQAHVIKAEFVFNLPRDLTYHLFQWSSLRVEIPSPLVITLPG